MSSIPGDTSTTATITQGQVINGELTFAGDADWYRAELTAGLDYGFRVSGNGSGSSLPDPDLYLYDSVGTRIAGDTNYSNTSASLSYSISATGSYYVGVKDSSDLGNYVLSWIGNDTVLRNTSTTATLAVGGTFASTIDVVGDSDWIKIELVEGLNYGFRVSGDGSGSSLPDGDIHLRDDSGNRLVDGTNYSNSSYSIYTAAARTGTYYLDITDSSDTGNYKVSWLGNDTILRNVSTTEVLGQQKSITSAIDVTGDSDWFKVTLKAGISYAFNVQGTGTTKLPDGDIHLRDADGNRIVDGTNYSNSSYTIAYTPTSGGTFFVEVTDSSDIGGYKVTNIGKDTILNNTGTNSSIAEGTSLTGTFDANRDSDWHSLKVKAGTTYEIDLSGTGGANGADDVLLTLRDANGNRIDYFSGETASLTWKATKSGTVYIDTAGRDFETTGKYELSVVSDAPRLNGTEKADDLTGGWTKTTINGYGGNDRLDGGAGNDILIGGKGIDKLIGGAGRDTFVFATGDTGKTNKTADLIADFNAKQDLIDLTGYDANSKKGGMQDFDFIGTDAFSKHAGELRYAKQGGDTWIQGDTNGDGKADFIIHLDGLVKLTESHFDL